MSRYIAFLRAINVGGHTVKMGELRELFGSMGFDDVETYIASGNVIFRAASDDVAELERRIEERLQSVLGYEVVTFLRSDTELARVASIQPFEAAEVAASGSYNVGFLSEALSPNQLALVDRLTTDIDRFHHHGRELYWLCSRRQSESTFSNAVFEKRVGVRSTLRGMKTVVALAEKYPPG